jgi:broad specificity phosphatase PhoE
MLRRIESALQDMVETAAFETETGCIAAVTHSVFLRLLLGTVQGSSMVFTPVTSQQQANCCINVLDFPRPTTGSTSKLASTTIPESDFRLPNGRVIRMNENRHLASIQS